MEQGVFGNILGILGSQSGVDFSRYKHGLLRRRIQRRMTALQLESAEDYERYLRAHPSEIQSLLNDVLVTVAGFFRLPAAFRWLKKSHHSPGDRAAKAIPDHGHLEIGGDGTGNAHGGVEGGTERGANVDRQAGAKNSELDRVDDVSSLYKALVESSDDAIITKDLNGIILTWNQGAERIFGYTADEIIGKSVTVLMPEDCQKEEPLILARIRAGGRIDHYETVRVRKDGRLLDISISVSPIINAAGRVIGASKIARDITERKRWEAELRHAHDEAERANQAKDDFLAALSHELRTPLSPVLLLAGEAASDRDLPPGVRANFDVIRRNIELEARLVDDLLDLSRIRTGKLKIERADVSIHLALSDTLSILHKEIEQKGIALKEDLRDSESVISGDAVRLRQIFWNILTNAIKFTPPGGSITVQGHAESGHYIVQISDTGIGMTPAELTSAFEPFRQGGHSRDPQRFGGLGLGLAISKRFIELHSGSIEAASPGINCGSTFTVRFRLAGWNRLARVFNLPPIQTQPTDGLHFAPEFGKNKHHAAILLVEDHEATRSSLARILQKHHHKVVTASSAGEAIAVAEKEHFDVVISDIGLPDGNGYDLFRKIHDKSPVVKGIALSGYGMERDLDQSRNSGFHSHLIKPVKIQALERALEETLAD